MAERNISGVLPISRLGIWRRILKLNVYKKYLVLPISRLNYCNNYLFFMTTFGHTTSKLQHMVLLDLMRVRLSSFI